MTHPVQAAAAPRPEEPFSMLATLDHGHPDLRRVQEEHWLPALRAGIEEQQREVEALVSADQPATVRNTLHPLGRSGQLLRRAQRAFSCVFSADGTPALQQVQAEIAPELAEHRDWMQLHPALFSRLRDLAENMESPVAECSAEQRRMVDQLLLQSRSAGAELSESAQKELRGLNKELAHQETAYQQLQRSEAEQAALLVPAGDPVAGLDRAQRGATAAAAQDEGHDESHLLRLKMPVQQPLLSTLRDRRTRRLLHEASVGRGSLNGHDGRNTREIGARIVVLRARRARLLGHAHHLDTVLPLRTAPDRASIESMLHRLADGGLRRLETELEQVSAHLRRTGELDGALEPWDVTYGIAAVKREASATSLASTAGSQTSQAPQGGTLTLETTLGRVFESARRVYGIDVLERPDLPGFVEGARSVEIRDADGETLGLYLLDPYARPTKSGGAWMNSFSVASSLTGGRPVVINCLNLAPPASGETAVLGADEQRTLFHEFGHALHGVLAEAEFEELSGTAVPRDNVEFPSQVNEVFAELWTDTPSDSPSSAGGGADTGAGQSSQWGRGLRTVEHVAAVVLDLAWHTLSPEQAGEAAQDPEDFEHRALADWGLDHPLVPPRYSTGFFKHIFAGSGYAAGYYSYLWAEVLAADAAEWFREAMGDEHALSAAGAHFRRELLSRGNTREPYESFRAAFGHEPDVEPLLRSLGMDDDAAH